MEKAECHHLEDTASVDKGKKEMEEVLQNWYGPFSMSYYFCRELMAV